MNRVSTRTGTMYLRTGSDARQNSSLTQSSGLSATQLEIRRAAR
jgi:hypothetical protein